MKKLNTTFFIFSFLLSFPSFIPDTCQAFEYKKEYVYSIGNILKTSFKIGGDKKLYAKGLNDRGQLGLGHKREVSQFTEVKGIKDAVHIDTSFHNTFILHEDGRISVMGPMDQYLVLKGKSKTKIYQGGNKFGEFGLGHNDHVYRPQEIPGIDHAVYFVLKRKSTFVLKADGTLWAFGSDIYGLGDVREAFVPTKVVGVEGAMDIDSVGDLYFVLLNNGRVMAFGNNWRNALGVDPEREKVYRPMYMKGVERAIGFHAEYSVYGSKTLFIVREDGRRWEISHKAAPKLVDGNSK